ncbi:hypothetical protein ACN5XJ_26565 (plasmid) [Priestia sp. MF3]|uniref:hypothetical protein n=1 Tax=Priestia sp. MF3 TaxID=3404779 RepID=UPI003BA10698
MLDFDSTDEMKRFLKRDKHKLLEGMVAEELFKQDILKKDKIENRTSKGWWAIEDPLNRSEYMLFHVTEDRPNKYDIEIYELLLELDILVTHVILQKNNFYFLEINKQILKSQLKEEDYVHEYLFLVNYGLIKYRSIHLAEREHRDPFLQDRAIQFIEKQGILKEVAIQRYFVNHFLTVHFEGFPINLDGLMRARKGLTVFEVKFKFPFPDDLNNYYYGVNKGQVKLFKWLLQSNIHIYHYIAKNPGNKKTIGIFEVLSTSELKQNFYWEASFLNTSDLDNKDFIAPKETSIAGDKPVYFKPISAEGFEKDSPVAANLVLPSIPKQTCPKCKEDIIVKNGKYGYYLQCSKHREHNE